MSATKFVVTGTAAYVAGASHVVTVTSDDNTYTGDHSIVFSGAANAPDGTHPTVANKTSADTNFGVATVMTFTSGVASGAMKLYKAEVALIVATEGGLTTSGADRLTATVTAGTITEYKLTGSSTQAAGAAQTVIITAGDGFHNTDLTHTGDKSLTFSGPSNSTGGSVPTATSKTSAVVNFGTSTTITFTAGVATTSIVLYKNEVALIAVTNGTQVAASTDRLSVTVSAITVSTNPHGDTTVLPLASTFITGTVSAGTKTYSIVSGDATVDASGNVAIGIAGSVVVRVTSVIDTGAHADITLTVTAILDSGATILELNGPAVRYIQNLLHTRRSEISADPFRQKELAVINDALASLNSF